MVYGILFYCYEYYLPEWVRQIAILNNAFYRVGRGGTGDEFMEPRGRWPRKSLGITDLDACHQLIGFLSASGKFYIQREQEFSCRVVGMNTDRFIDFTYSSHYLKSYALWVDRPEGRSVWLFHIVLPLQRIPQGCNKPITLLNYSWVKTCINIVRSLFVLSGKPSWRRRETLRLS
jgi:hypothetical protein